LQDSALRYYIGMPKLISDRLLENFKLMTNGKDFKLQHCEIGKLSD